MLMKGETKRVDFFAHDATEDATDRFANIHKQGVLSKELSAGLANICGYKKCGLRDQQVLAPLAIAFGARRDYIPVVVSEACLLNVTTGDRRSLTVGCAASHRRLAAKVLPMERASYRTGMGAL